LFRYRGLTFLALYESLFFAAVFIGLAFWLHGDDPFFIHSGLPVRLIPLAIVTLYFGYAGGVPYLAAMGVGMWYGYPAFPTNVFLVDTVLMLLFAEFHSYWERRLGQLERKEAYLHNKFTELTTAFYMLKISHDQLEKNYVIKPMSLRNAIGEIRSKLGDESEESFQLLLTLFEKNFSVQAALIVWEDEKGTLRTRAATQDLLFYRDDTMVEEALERKEPVYISGDVDAKSHYIAVIPAVLDDKVKGLMCIGKMPFLSFNKDTLVSLAILLDYFSFELMRSRWLRLFANRVDLVSTPMSFEFQRLERIEKEHGLESSIIAFNCRDALSHTLLSQQIEKGLRALDRMDVVETKARGKVILVLLPFSGRAVVEGYLSRLASLLEEEKRELCPHVVFTMRWLPQLREYLEGKGLQ